MKTYENKNFIAKVTDEKVVITNKKFGDVYVAKFDKNNKLVANTALALKYAINMRNEFNF